MLVMIRATALGVVLAAASLLTACQLRPDAHQLSGITRASHGENQWLRPHPLPLPQGVIRRVSYICADGSEVRVDVLADPYTVSIREGRSVTSRLLRRRSETVPFEDGQRALSGTGAQVRYARPGRPEQICRAFA